MDKAIYLYGKETSLKKGEERTKRIARMGGIASGETRYLKALRRQQVKKTIADMAYCYYLKDVTEKELKAFIRWRHREGEQAILAEAHLKDEDKDASHRYALGFMPMCCHVYGTRDFLSAREIFSKYQTDYDKVGNIFENAIFNMMSELEECHFNHNLCFRGFSKIKGYKETIAKATKNPSEYRPRNEAIKPLWTRLCVNTKKKSS